MSYRPNVLWIMTDEQRTDSLGCYGSPWAQSPTIDRLASEGVRFTNAVTPAPVCVPARTSLITGRYPNETRVWSNLSGVPEPCFPLTMMFESAGYRTATFGKQHYFASAAPAFQTQREFILSDEVYYYGYADDWNQADYGVVQYPPEPEAWVFAGRFPAERDTTGEARAVAAAKSWLEEESSTDKSFFLRISFNGPHTPVVPPAPFDTCIDPSDIALPGPPDDVPGGASQWLHDRATVATASRLSDDEIRRMRQAYYGEVAYLDQLVGDLLGWMDERGLLDNLIIAFCSDHGTHLGDFGLVQKQTFFDPVVNVPYFFWGPGIVSAQPAVHRPVEVRSLLPTLLDLAGLEVPDGCARSLAPVLRGGVEPPATPVFSEFIDSSGLRGDARVVMVRDEPWKLSVLFDPQPSEVMLTNLHEDPGERVNRADDPEAVDIRERLLKLAVDHVDGDEASTSVKPGLKPGQRLHR